MVAELLHTTGQLIGGRPPVDLPGGRRRPAGVPSRTPSVPREPDLRCEGESMNLFSSQIAKFPAFASLFAQGAPALCARQPHRLQCPPPLRYVPAGFRGATLGQRGLARLPHRLGAARTATPALAHAGRGHGPTGHADDVPAPPVAAAIGSAFTTPPPATSPSTSR